MSESFLSGNGMSTVKKYYQVRDLKFKKDKKGHTECFVSENKFLDHEFQYEVELINTRIGLQWQANAFDITPSGFLIIGVFITKLEAQLACNKHWEMKLSKFLVND